MAIACEVFSWLQWLKEDLLMRWNKECWLRILGIVSFIFLMTIWLALICADKTGWGPDADKMVASMKESNFVLPAIPTDSDANTMIRQSDQDGLNDEELLVDYDKSLDDEIRSAKYSFPNRALSPINEENFPQSKEGHGKKRLVVRVFNFPGRKVIHSHEAIREMAQEGYRPATLRELMVFSEARPKFKEEYKLVALGSVWDDTAFDSLIVPVVSRNPYYDRFAATFQVDFSLAGAYSNAGFHLREASRRWHFLAVRIRK